MFSRQFMRAALGHRRLGSGRSNVRKCSGAAGECTDAALVRIKRAGCSPVVLANERASHIYLLPGLLDSCESKQLLSAMLEWKHWARESDDFGPQDRLTAYFGDVGADFAYVGLKLTPRPWLPCLLEPLERVQRVVASAYGVRLTGCLANYYSRGTSHIPWHSDEVRAHGAAKLIASLSVGGERSMGLRNIATGEERFIRLPAGSVLVQAGEAQTHWQHCLPLESTDSPLRISLTFRSIEIGFESGRALPSGLHAKQSD